MERRGGKRRSVDEEINSCGVFLVVDKDMGSKVTQVRLKNGKREILGQDDGWHEISEEKTINYRKAFQRGRRDDSNFGERVKSFWKNITGAEI